MKHYDKLSIAEYNDIISNGGVVVKFGAEWCGPCRIVDSILTTISIANTDITFISINIDTCDEITQLYSIQSVPTILYISNGELLHSTMGISTPQDILNNINMLRS